MSPLGRLLSLGDYLSKAHILVDNDRLTEGDAQAITPCVCTEGNADLFTPFGLSPSTPLRTGLSKLPLTLSLD